MELGLGLDGEKGEVVLGKHTATENLPEGVFVLEFSIPEISYCKLFLVQ